MSLPAEATYPEATYREAPPLNSCTLKADHKYDGINHRRCQPEILPFPERPEWSEVV